MLRRSAGMLLLVGLAACDYPTEPPQWDQTWVVPGESITVSVAELLPAGIGLNEDSTLFVAETTAASIQLTLADVCGTACLLVTGMEAPKPEFEDTLATTSALPDDLVSATLAGGSVDMVIGHDFSFDPLRPSMDPEAPRGHLVIRVTSGGVVVARDSINGDDVPFPGGTQLFPELPIQPVTVADSLDIEIIIYSPAGDSTTVEVTDTVGITANPSTVQISEVTVNATGVDIDGVTTSLDFTEVDSTLVDRIMSGALRLDITNPWAVTGTLDLSFQGVSAPIDRTLAIAEGSYTERVEFSGAELQSILNAGAVDVVANGSVEAGAGAVTVTPTQKLVLDGDFELVVLVGPSEDL